MPKITDDHGKIIAGAIATLEFYGVTTIVISREWKERLDCYFSRMAMIPHADLSRLPAPDGRGPMTVHRVDVVTEDELKQRYARRAREADRA